MTTIIWPLSVGMTPKRKPLIENLAETLGHRLARLRKERGITQDELAARLHISQANVSDYERGRIRLHADVIIELTRIFNVSSDELLGLEPSGRSKPIKDLRVLQRLRLIDGLPKRDKDALLRTLNAFLSRMEAHRTASTA